jgi:hypothetical protein
MAGDKSKKTTVPHWYAAGIGHICGLLQMTGAMTGEANGGL